MARALSNPVRVAAPQQGVDGRTTLAKARAPLVTDGRVGDFFIDTVAKKLYGPKSAAGWPDNGLIRGAAGWYPLERVVSDGTRRVVQVYDWAGGEGTKPATGYKTASGALTATIADGVDTRGAPGPEMVVSAVDPGVDDVTYEALSVVAKSGDDNERQPIKNIFAAGGQMAFRTVAEATSATVPARVTTVQIGDATDELGGLGHLRQRVEEEPASGPKHRSADRFTPDGGTDSANGGWWAPAQVGGHLVKVPARPETTPIGERFAKVISLKSDYGAKGNNVDADDAAFNSAIAEAEGSDFPIAIELDGGAYRINDVLTTITKPIQFISRNEREAVITPRGTAAFKFAGASQRVANAGFRNVQINGVAMAAGPAVEVDWAQGFRMENTILSDCYSGLKIRQAGDTTLSNVQIDKIRAGIGLEAIGPRGTRNGEIDKIDVIDMKSVTITGTYVPGVTSPIGTAILLDGHVHTINYDVLRILGIRAGLVTKNTYAHAQEFVPSFLHGTSLEVENTWLEGIRLEALNEWCGAATFQSTSVSLSGIYLGAAVYDVKLFGATPRTNWKYGVEIEGAKNLGFFGLSSHRNGGAGAGFAGVVIISGDDICFVGGKLGKNNVITAYTEAQSWGIDNVAGTNVRLIGVDLRNNATATHQGGMQFTKCPGVSRVPSTAASTASSPYSFTPGEDTVVNIYGGTGLTVTVDGVVVGNNLGTYYVPAGSVFNVTFSATLFYTQTVMR